MPPEDPRIGTSYGAYRLERRLGEGGMGMVYVATHARTGRRYAVKLLHPAEPGSPAEVQGLARFRREARALSDLRHANVVAIHDFDVTDRGEPFLVMELLEGEPLAGRIDRGRGLPFAEATRIFHELAAALDALHDAGVVHRDVKPSNVLLARVPGGEERAVLVDFGLAKDLAPDASKVTAPDTTLGTPAYMAPEQARGQPIDRRTDVYALGIVLYEMIAGRTPFVGPTPTAVIAQTLVDPPPPLTSMTRAALPAGIDAVIARALAKDPLDRFPSTRVFSDAIRVVAGETTLTLPETRALPIAEPPRRGGRAALIVASLASIGALALALAWSQRPSSSRPEEEDARASSPPMQPLEATTSAPSTTASPTTTAPSPTTTTSPTTTAPSTPTIAPSASPSTTTSPSTTAARSPSRPGLGPVPAPVPTRTPTPSGPGASVPTRTPTPSGPSPVPGETRSGPRNPQSLAPVTTDPITQARAHASARRWRDCVSSLTAHPTIDRDDLELLMICADRAHDRAALERGCREIDRLLLHDHPWHERCRTEILGRAPARPPPSLRGDDLAEHEAEQLRQRGDFAGCARRAADVERSYSGLMMRLDCAELSGDPSLLRAACRRYIDARIPARTRFNPLCESVLR